MSVLRESGGSEYEGPGRFAIGCGCSNERHWTGAHRVVQKSTRWRVDLPHDSPPDDPISADQPHCADCAHFVNFRDLRAKPANTRSVDM